LSSGRTVTEFFRRFYSGMGFVYNNSFIAGLKVFRQESVRQKITKQPPPKGGGCLVTRSMIFLELLVFTPLVPLEPFARSYMG
jgi:hypothetical protein